MMERMRNMEKRELVCIGCPKGCVIIVEMQEKEILSLTGYTCKKGREYARKEVTHPMRSVTSTVCVRGGRDPLVSVKTDGEIPKEKIFACMEEIRKLVVKAPVQKGDVLIFNIAGTGVPLKATSDVQAKL